MCGRFVIAILPSSFLHSSQGFSGSSSLTSSWDRPRFPTPWISVRSDPGGLPKLLLRQSRYLLTDSFGFRVDGTKLLYGRFWPKDGVGESRPDVPLRALSVDAPGQTTKVRWQRGVADTKQIDTLPSECSEEQAKLKNYIGTSNQSRELTGILSSQFKTRVLVPIPASLSADKDRSAYADSKCLPDFALICSISRSSDSICSAASRRASCRAFSKYSLGLRKISALRSCLPRTISFAIPHSPLTVDVYHSTGESDSFHVHTSHCRPSHRNFLLPVADAL